MELNEFVQSFLRSLKILLKNFSLETEFKNLDEYDL